MDGWGLGVILLAGENQAYVSNRQTVFDRCFVGNVCVYGGGTTSDRWGQVRA